MTYKETLTFEEAYQLVSYNSEEGTFFWKYRDRKYFNSDKSFKIWNTRYANKKAGTINTVGYVQIAIFNKPILAHRLAFLLVTKEYPTDRIDHIDKNKLNNKFSNLRIASHSQNLANTGLWKTNTSGHKGVTWDKQRQKWQSKIKDKGKTVHLGRFDNIEKAAEAYINAALKIYGEYVSAAAALKDTGDE